MHQKILFASLLKTISLMMIVGLLCTFFLCSGGSVIAATASAPGGNLVSPEVHTVDLAQPAVVRIITTSLARLTVHFPPTTDVTFPQQNNGKYTIQFSGTGTFVTSQGDILTADHVVNTPQQELNQAIYNAAAQEIADYLNKHSQQGSSQVTRDQVIQQLKDGTLKADPQIDKPGSVAFMSTDYSGQSNAPDFKNLPANIATQVDKIKKESPPDQKDVAIIHVPLTDTLNVQLGDSSSVQKQDKLTIIGFPGNADISARPDDILNSSVNQIEVSSIKTSESGSPLIQVGGNVEQGDSGGPALDTTGNIVGIVSFGVLSQSGPNGTSFLQASNSARDLITSLKLDTTPGKQQQLWSKALADYASTTPGHWGKAAQEFGQLITSYPNFKAARAYRDYAKSQSAGESKATNTPGTSAHSHPAQTVSSVNPVLAIVLTVGGIAVVLLLGALSFMTALRQRNKTDASRTQKQTGAPNPITPPAGLPAKLSGPLVNQNTAPPINSPIPAVGTVPGIAATNKSPASGTTPNTLTLKVWPCGHLNRPNARFCSICGEPAPESPAEP